MFSFNRDTVSLAVAVLVVAACYYLFMEVKKQKGDIERCKTFSIELAQKVHQQVGASRPAPPPPPAPPQEVQSPESVVGDEE